MMRPILSVLAGFALWSVVSLGSNAVVAMIAPDAFNEDGTTDSAILLLLFLVISVVCSLGSGFLTAALARARSAVAAWSLGGLLLAVGLFVQVLNWDAQPLWFHIPFLALLVPGVLAGAKLHRSRMGAS